MDSDASAAVYSRQLVERSFEVEKPQRLSAPDLTARSVSVICGSTVEVDLNVSDGKVTAFGFEVEACALTKTVVAVMRRAILGKTREEIARAGEGLRRLLSGAESTFAADWVDLSLLAPVADFKARHNAVLLPFVAVEKAFLNKK